MTNQNITTFNEISNPITLFNFNSIDVRVFTKDNEAWFVGSDVAKALGYSNPQKAVQMHCKAAENYKSPILGSLGIKVNSPRGLILIPERDVYRLIMKSKLPSAEQFEEKVVGEILPSIRKTGTYSLIQSQFQIPQTYPEALRLAADQAEQIKELKPKADGFDRIATADGSLCITDAAKNLQVGPKELFFYLNSHEWIYRRTGNKNWLAYQDKIKQGLLEHKVTEVSLSDGTSRISEQVRITPKGLTRLSEMFSNHV